MSATVGGPAGEEAVVVRGLVKTFTLHVQGGVLLPVLQGVGVTVRRGECVALRAPSGAGKSTLLRTVYGNYRAQGGQVLVRHDGGAVDMATAGPREVLAVRRRTLGYVSQFLRVVPRVPTLAVVAEPLRALGLPRAAAERRAARLLGRLAIPERLWGLPPATFSGGEQQRVNVARGLVADLPILLLDEPTAALDDGSRAAVVELILEARGRGTAILGAFHDADVRDAVASRVVGLDGTEAVA